MQPISGNPDCMMLLCLGHFCFFIWLSDIRTSLYNTSVKLPLFSYTATRHKGFLLKKRRRKFQDEHLFHVLKNTNMLPHVLWWWLPVMGSGSWGSDCLGSIVVLETRQWPHSVTRCRYWYFGLYSMLGKLVLWEACCPGQWNIGGGVNRNPERVWAGNRFWEKMNCLKEPAISD